MFYWERCCSSECDFFRHSLLTIKNQVDTIMTMSLLYESPLISCWRTVNPIMKVEMKDLIKIQERCMYIQDTR